MTIRKWKKWFGVMLVLTLAASIASILIGNYWSNYIEQDIEHNYVTWFGIEYGVGMGSINFCSRMFGAGFAGLSLAGAEVLIFPKWLKIHLEEKEARA